MKIHRMGGIVAAAFVAIIEDVRRFLNPKRLCAYFVTVSKDFGLCGFYAEI